MKIITWLWEQPNGRAKYEPSHVAIWADMIRRNLTLPHKLAVVTDIKADFGDVEVIAPPGDFEEVTIPTWREGRPQCFRRLSMFRPDAAEIFGADRLVQLDLDVVITSSIDSLFTGNEDFRICRGTARTRSFNGSMFMLRAGSRPKVFTEFTPQRAIEAGRKHVGSDQSWMAHCLAGEPTWGPEHGIVANLQRHLAPSPRMITYPGALKPWHVVSAGFDRVVIENYRRTPRGDALLLGYSPTVWDEVGIALDARKKFDGVIAAPETAEHWPGPVVAIARDDRHAERLAKMHGFTNTIFCGRSGEQTHGAP